jgi:hypothetical protein
MTPNAFKPALITSDASATGSSKAGLKGREALGFSGREEPTLQDLMDDPILLRLMASDGVRSEHLLAMIANLRARLGTG